MWDMNGYYLSSSIYFVYFILVLITRLSCKDFVCIIITYHYIRVVLIGIYSMIPDLPVVHPLIPLGIGEWEHGIAGPWPARFGKLSELS